MITEAEREATLNAAKTIEEALNSPVYRDMNETMQKVFNSPFYHDMHAAMQAAVTSVSLKALAAELISAQEQATKHLAEIEAMTRHIHRRIDMSVLSPGAIAAIMSPRRFHNPVTPELPKRTIIRPEVKRKIGF